jgi:NTE family protein
LSEQKRLLDGVFEGGGVKGIALVGALEEIEQAGYQFVNVAGTSAGSIVATLVAAGYSAAELKPIMMDLPFHKFMDAPWVGHIPVAGGVINMLRHHGLYKGDYFEHLMRDVLRAKKKRVFGDLLLDKQRFPRDADDPRYRFTARVVASDITRRRLLVLPDDIAEYGEVPEELDIARAVRMSMSIPLFFFPVKLPFRQAGATRREASYVVDGGLLSNFPVELFDAAGVPEWPTFGFKLTQDDDAQFPTIVRHPIHGLVSMLQAMFFTAVEAHDARYLKSAKFVRTIAIDSRSVAGNDFNLSQDKKTALYESGRAAAKAFLDHWDFEQYTAQYRSGRPIPSRREQVLPKAAR